MSLKWVLLFLSILIHPVVSFAQNIPSAGQIEKTQQDIEEGKALRTEVEQGRKTLIKNIIIRGATLLTQEQINEIILPFKGHWLTKTDIQLILDSITTAYRQNGYQDQPAKISRQVKGYDLEITVEEISP